MSCSTEFETDVQPVHELLSELAIRDFDATDGRAMTIYPRRHELRTMVRQSSLERGLAAWKYLDWRLGEQELLKESDLAASFIRLGRRVAVQLARAESDADRRLGQQVSQRIHEFIKKQREQETNE